MTETPLHEAACTCRSAGECDTCKRWQERFAEIMARMKERGDAR